MTKALEGFIALTEAATGDRLLICVQHVAAIRRFPGLNPDDPVMVIVSGSSFVVAEDMQTVRRRIGREGDT